MNLQIALIALGIIVVVAVYFFSRWQSERINSKLPTNRSTEPQLSSEEKDEPSFDLAPQSEVETGYQGALEDDQEKQEIPVLERRADTTKTKQINPEVIQSEDEEDDDSENFRLIIPEEDRYNEPAGSVDEILGTSFDDREEAPSITEGLPPVNPPTLETLATSSIAEEIAEEIEFEEEHIRSKPEFIIEPVSEDLAIDIDSEWSQNADLIIRNNTIQEDVPELELEAIVPELESIEPELNEDIDPDLEQQRPSLRNFLGSIKPKKATEALGKLKGDLQTRLETVKADRDNTYQGYTGIVDDPVEEVSEPPILETPIELESEIPVLDMPVTELDSPPELLIDPIDHRHSDPAVETEQPAEIATVSTTEPDAILNEENAPQNNLSPAEGFDKLSQIDYYVKLNGDRDVSRESVLAIYRESASRLSKAHSIYGLRMPDKVWRDLENEPEESRFGDIIITIQLVDQRGPVSEQEMSKFSNLVMNLSETTGRGFSFMAPIENAIQQANAIDQFRQQFDSIFVVNIKPIEDEFFEGPIIDRCAKQIGLTPDDNSFYTRYKPIGKEQKVTLYSLANMSDTGEFDLENMRAVRTRGVTVFTRPAVNRSPGAVFAEMVDAAKALASRIKGEVIAPGHDGLSTDDAEAIRRSIETVAKEMESYGITPGSEEAIRLF